MMGISTLTLRVPTYTTAAYYSPSSKKIYTIADSISSLSWHRPITAQCHNNIDASRRSNRNGARNIFQKRNDVKYMLPTSSAGIALESSGLGSLSNESQGASPQVSTGFWNWQGYNIRYQFAGSDGPALVLVHGFGANCDHWRKNLPFLAKSHRVYAIDLLGYGYSDKPNPRDFPVNSLYTFETWAKQVNDFCVDVVKDKAFFICNSIGGIVGLQAALMEKNICRGIVLLNISLRMLHIKKQSWYKRPFIKLFQNLLRDTNLGRIFFKSVATPKAVKSILCQCYHNDSEVTDELVKKILLPGLQPGAVDVFLSFICYSDGPLAEDMIPQMECPVLVAWGNKDPWEPIELGRTYGALKNVEDFVVLPNVGHCPQDEAPHLVNPLVEEFVARHVGK